MSSVFDGLADHFVEHLGERELLPYTRAGQTVELLGIFEEPFFLVPGAEDVAGLAGTQPTLAVRTADLPTGAGDGDIVKVRGVVWRVKGPPQQDGRGMSRLVLERAV